MDESDQELLSSIGRLFADVRNESGLTQREAAALAGSNQARISYLENGKADIFILTLRRWAMVYGYDVEVHLVPLEDEATKAWNELLAATINEIEEEKHGSSQGAGEASVLSEMRSEVPHHGAHDQASQEASGL